MSIDLGKLGYKVFIDDKQYRDGLRKLLGETQKSSSQINGIFSKLATTAVLGTVFFKSIGQARAFSKELANLKSIAWDLDMEKVRKEILDLNATLGNSAELTNAMYFAYSAGVRGTEKELARFTALAAELAQTVGAGITPVMDAMTTMMNAYGLKVADAANLTDWFYQIVKSGKTTGPELAQSLGQIAATAASANISLDELGAALATLTTTMPTNIAVTSLAAAIRTMVNPTEDARNAARNLGIDLSQSAIQAKGFSGVMQEIFDKTQGRADLIGKLFPAESSRAILSLAGTQIETFTATLSDFEGKAGNAKKGFEAILESDDKKWEAMLIVLQKLGTAVGDLIFNILTLGGVLNPVYSAINDMGSGTVKLIARIGAFAGVMLGVAKAAAGLKILKNAFTDLSTKGGYKTAGMLTIEAEQNKQTSAALQAEKESAVRIAAEKRVALAKANAAAEDAIRKQQEIISTRAAADARVIAEQNARVQATQTAQAVIVAEKTKELAVARSVAVQMALEKQRYMYEMQNRAKLLPHLIAQKQQEIALATQAGTLTKEQTASLASLQKEYANITSDIQKATKESVKSANAAKLARKAEIDGIAQANRNAQQKISQAQTSANRAIAESQKATKRATDAAAQSVQQTANHAKQAAATYHSARTAATQAAAAQQTHNAAIAAGTVQVGFLKGVVKGLWATISANPIGFILMSATLAYTGIMYLLNMAEEKAKEKIEKANKLMEEAEGRKQKTEEQVQKDTPKFSRLETLAKKDALSDTEMKEAESLIAKLQVEWGELGIELDKEAKKIVGIKKEIKDLSKQDQTFTIKGKTDVPAVPETPDQTFTIKGKTDVPAVPETPDQTFTIKGKTDVPAVPKTPDQTFTIKGKTDVPAVPKTPDQTFTIKGKTDVPAVPETPDQTFTIKGKTDVPAVPKTPDQTFTIKGKTDVPAVPETPDQTFTIKGKTDIPDIPQTPDQVFSIMGYVIMPAIPKIKDQTFTIKSKTEKPEAPASAGSNDAIEALTAAREKMKQRRLEANIREQKAVEGKKSVLEEQEREKLESQGNEYMTNYAVLGINNLPKEDQEKPREVYFKSLSEEDKKFREDMNKILAAKGLSLENVDRGNKEYKHALSQVAKQRLSADNKEYQDLTKKSKLLSVERRDIRSGRDPEKEEQEKNRIEGAKKETARIEQFWQESSLTDTDKKEQEIRKEYDLYMKNLKVLKESRNITDEEYKKRSAEARLRKDNRIDENKLDREKTLALLSEQEKAWADGRLTTEEQISIRKTEILHLEKELAKLQGRARNTKSADEKRNLELAVSRTKTQIAQKKGENKAAEEDYFYENREKNRTLEMEKARNKYSLDGVLSADDTLALKKLELAQQTARIKELEVRMNKAQTQELQRQFAIEKAKAAGKKSLLAEEIRQAEEKRKLEKSEEKRNMELLALQIEQKKDGIITDKEKQELLALQITQQTERVKELQRQENSLVNKKGKEDLLLDIRKQRLQADNALSDLYMAQQNKSEGKKDARGAFSASVLGLMSASPIEVKQLQKMTEVREDLRKLERRSRNNSSSSSRYLYQ